MKNGAIIIKDEWNFSFSGVKEILKAFCQKGYPFEETRILSDTESAVDAVSSMKEKYDNLLVIVKKEKLLSFSDRLALFYETPFTQGTKAGAGYFEEEGCLFLLADQAIDGEEYAVNCILPYLDRKYRSRRSRMVFRAVGVEENIAQELIKTVKRISGEQLIYTYHEHYGDCIFEIDYDENASKMLIDDVVRVFVEKLEEDLYAMDESTLEEQLVRLLEVRCKKISVAESFTGGGIGRRITSVSGASQVYFEGINSYSEESKEMRLGVSAYTLNSFGAVSDDTAYEMAAGLLSTKKCDVCISTTGIAGPKSDRTDAPVGLAYIGVGLGDQIYVYRYRFAGTREEITETAINYALFNAYRKLKE